MCEIKVVNKRKASYDIYIGRGSLWGNPFVIGKDGDREAVINNYKKYFIEGIKSGKFKKSDLQSLKGKTLGCFCKPLKNIIKGEIYWKNFGQM